MPLYPLGKTKYIGKHTRAIYYGLICEDGEIVDLEDGLGYQNIFQWIQSVNMKEKSQKDIDNILEKLACKLEN
jgi:hypothetical protein